jgi:tetratricopeptide (TPR) repeat protein
VAATFQNQYLLGSSAYHMERAMRVLPRDPILLFYAGAMHEGLASPAVQSVYATAPGAFSGVAVRSKENQLREAQRYLSDAVKAGAPLEAQLRLGRVLGRLGKHADAVKLLSQAVPSADDKRLAYFRELLLGTEQGALRQVEAARASFDRAAALFPTAQAPLIAMSHLFRQSGNRAAALEAFRRLQALPADASGRSDPWWDYHRSYAADAEDQLNAVRAWVDLKGPR